MSVPKNLAITFDKDALDKALQAKRESEAKPTIDNYVDQVYGPGKSPSHLGKQFVAARAGVTQDPIETVNKTRFGMGR